MDNPEYIRLFHAIEQRLIEDVQAPAVDAKAAA